MCLFYLYTEVKTDIHIFSNKKGLIDNIYSDQTIRIGVDHSPTILHFKMFDAIL